MQKEQYENKVTQCINCLENNQHFLFRRWLYSHASIAVAFSDLVIMNMLIAGTQGP